MRSQQRDDAEGGASSVGAAVDPNAMCIAALTLCTPRESGRVPVRRVDPSECSPITRERIAQLVKRFKGKRTRDLPLTLPYRRSLAAATKDALRHDSGSGSGDAVTTLIAETMNGHTIVSCVICSKYWEELLALTKAKTGRRASGSARKGLTGWVGRPGRERWLQHAAVQRELHAAAEAATYVDFSSMLQLAAVMLEHEPDALAALDATALDLVGFGVKHTSAAAGKRERAAYMRGWRAGTALAGKAEPVTKSQRIDEARDFMFQEYGKRSIFVLYGAVGPMRGIERLLDTLRLERTDGAAAAKSARQRL